MQVFWFNWEENKGCQNFSRRAGQCREAPSVVGASLPAAPLQTPRPVTSSTAPFRSLSADFLATSYCGVAYRTFKISNLYFFH